MFFGEEVLIVVLCGNGEMFSGEEVPIVVFCGNGEMLLGKWGHFDSMAALNPLINQYCQRIRPF
jgi:hypothetical protein